MRILVGEDEIVRAWVSQKIGQPIEQGETLGVLTPEGRLIGGFVFNHFQGDCIDMSLAGRGCILRSVWQAVGSYVYRQRGCARLQVVTRSSNKAVRSMAPRLKFKFEGKLRRFYGNEDGLLFSLLREEAIALGYYREA